MDCETDYTQEDVANEREAQGGTSRKSVDYWFSKGCVNAITAILARENEGLIINCCCPGWTQTEMGRSVGEPPKSPQEGAKIPVRLAFGDVGGATGKFWANEDNSSTGDGDIKDW